MTPIDIRPADLATIRRILREHLPALEVRAFGSRVAWNARETSDVDLALMTDEPLTVAQMADLRAAFTDADLPFRVDIVDWASTSEAFRRVVEAEYAVVARGRNRALVSTRKDANRSRRSVPANPGEPDHETRRFGDLFSESPRNGLTRPKAMRGFGTKMVNMGELFAHARLDNVPMDRVPLSESEAGRFLLERGDLLFARQSLVLEGAGKCSLFVGDDEPVTFESHVTRVRLDQTIANPSYYFYSLQSHHGRSAVRAIVEQGAGASGIRGRDLATLDVLWRPLPEQGAIAHILGTLDDKIELNRRMNATLEAMARTLFQSWFVDFDPVRAKMEGCDTGLPKDIADLFPNRLVDSELGEIPESWPLVPLPELIEVNPSRSLRRGEIAPYLDMANMPISGHAPDSVVQRRFNSGMRFANGDTLVARITPCLENGKTAYVDFLRDDEIGWGSTEYIVMRPRHPLPSAFAYLLARTARFRGFAIQNMSGTSGRQRVPAAALSGFSIPSPPALIGAAFGQAAQLLLGRARAAVDECRVLAGCRDALLPKLVSGELRTHGIRWRQRGTGSQGGIESRRTKRPER